MTKYASLIMHVLISQQMFIEHFYFCGTFKGHDRYKYIQIAILMLNYLKIIFVAMLITGKNYFSNIVLFILFRHFQFISYSSFCLSYIYIGTF